MPRTDADTVKGVLTARNFETAADMTPFIRWANLVVNKAARCALDLGTPYDDATLLEMETALAAFYYTVPDPMYKRKQTEKASGEFFDRSYLDMALMLDDVGCLRAIIKGIRAGAFWLGTPANSQRSYRERNG